jgi:hypothetical protein
MDSWLKKKWIEGGVTGAIGMGKALRTDKQLLDDLKRSVTSIRPAGAMTWIEVVENSDPTLVVVDEVSRIDPKVWSAISDHDARVAAELERRKAEAALDALAKDELERKAEQEKGVLASTGPEVGSW